MTDLQKELPPVTPENVAVTGQKVLLAVFEEDDTIYRAQFLRIVKQDGINKVRVVYNRFTVTLL